MNDGNISRFRATLYPHYDRLIRDVATVPGDKCFFCMQWGKNFSAGDGLFFAGRAVNGWFGGNEVREIFGDGKNAAFNRPDQMQWLEDAEGCRDYNTRNSAFWRLIRRISSRFYPENWSSHTAWSNVCKVAPDAGGNPDAALYRAQLKECREILREELRFLSPRAVVMLTGECWAKDFLEFLNGGVTPDALRTKTWGGGRYKCSEYKIDGTKVIVSEHPQGKNEDEHVDCILSML